MNVMLVPSSSGTTPSGALDPCSRWGDFLRSPGHGVMGPGRLMSRDVADNREQTGIPGHIQPHPKLYSSLVFCIPSRLSMALEPPTGVLLGT